MIPQRFIDAAKQRTAVSRPMTQSQYRRFLEIPRWDNTPTTAVSLDATKATINNLNDKRYHKPSNGLSAMTVFGPLWTKREEKRSSRDVNVPYKPIMNVHSEPIRYKAEDKHIVKDNRTVGMMAQEARRSRFEQD